MSTFSERLKQFIEHEQLTIYKVNKAAGLSTGLLFKALQGNKSISSESVERILRAYPQLNADWLLTGRGEMLVPQQATPPPPLVEPLPEELEKSLYRSIIWHLLLQDRYADTKRQLERCIALLEQIEARSAELKGQMLRIRQMLEANYQFQPQDHGLYEISLRIAAGDDGKFTPRQLKKNLQLSRRLVQYLGLDEEGK